MSHLIDETTGGRLELTGARARALLGSSTGVAKDSGKTANDNRTTTESTEATCRPLGAADVGLIAARIGHHSSIDAAAASAIAAEIVDRARTALAKIEQSTVRAALTDDDALALESVIHVRGRPAVRVLAERLESLERHPGSEFWQEYISQYEERIVSAAAVTGAVMVTVPSSGYPPWVQGSAWLIAPDRVVTNRHVLVPSSEGVRLVQDTGNGENMRLRAGHGVAIEFAADDRMPSAKVRRRVTGVLFVAQPHDPVDIAVLAIETLEGQTPLMLTGTGRIAPNNLFIVGHPGLMTTVPDKVRAVFGNPDGRKRVSFGKRLEGIIRHGEIVHDASTIGGYSGGPVVGISDGVVAGLHYYGDPVSGNLAITADAIRTHPAYQYMARVAP